MRLFSCLLACKSNPKQSIKNERVIKYLIESPYIILIVRIEIILLTRMNQVKEMVLLHHPFVVIQGTDDKVV